MGSTTDSVAGDVHGEMTEQRSHEPPSLGGGDRSVASIRADFPVLHQEVHGRPLVYLDNAATTQKPKAVIDALSRYYEHDNANVHRGVHKLSQRATAGYERAREKVQSFLGAADSKEIIFTRGTTEAVNLVANGWGRSNLGPGDEVLITWMEHHSNIVPWQLICQATGATLKVCPIDDLGQLDMEAFDKLLGPETKMVGVVHVSNALGTRNPVEEIVAKAHAVGALVLVDGAQAVAHEAVDVAALGCDFYTLSSHKIYGPTGVGALYGRRELLESMEPYQGGGDMILSVRFDKTIYAGLPAKFEAGTPNIAGAIGFGAALEYVESIGLDHIAEYEHALLQYGTGRLQTIDGLRMIGQAGHKAAVMSFVIDGIHPHDLGTIVDRSGVAIRTGHHCAQPVMERFGIPATARASLAVYNTRDDIDALTDALREAKRIFG